MKNYELFLILDPKKDEAAAQKTIREIEAVLNKLEAKVIKNQGGANTKMARPIGKKKDTYQVILEISAKPESLTEIRRQLVLLDQVLRVGIFTLEGV